MYSVNYATKQIIQGSDFFTKKAAENALADYIYFNTTYGIDIENVEVVRGGPYADFVTARTALSDTIFEEFQKSAGFNQGAFARYKQALAVKNPNQPQTFESMGFAPHQPLTALNL